MNFNLLEHNIKIKTDRKFKCRQSHLISFNFRSDISLVNKIYQSTSHQRLVPPVSGPLRQATPEATPFGF